MNCLRYTATLLKKHKNLPSAIFYTTGMMAAIVIYVVCPNICYLYIALFFFLMLMWDVDDSFNKERREVLIQHLSDVENAAEKFRTDLLKMTEKAENYKTLLTKNKENPIKSNRIVSDKTFAVRLLHFAEGVQACDAASEEELDYLKMIAERLLKWQTKTVRKDSEEYKYLERLGLMPEQSQNTEEHSMPEVKKRPSPKKRTKKEQDETKN